jgi:hypothetical protein
MLTHEELVLWAIRGLTQQCLDLLVKTPDEINSAKVRLRAQSLQVCLRKLDDLVAEGLAYGLVREQLPKAIGRMADLPR